jgi:hypothetical protein
MFSKGKVCCKVAGVVENNATMKKPLVNKFFSKKLKVKL